ncbi:MAG: LysM peptidoglycan-binding domain-containing protein [Pseudorhodoplanes sp.]|jgi:nucleoid-associated protein YgaU|nr:LysM peptidoglycan-binding domain-containing protein [Pseudorhodoplanes sp.]
MKGTLRARIALLSLLMAVAIGSSLVWWLHNHPELTQTSPVQSNPPAEAKRDAPATSAEKPASKSITATTEALKDLGAQLGTLKPAPSEPDPQFDAVRIDPNGDSVIAGRATPNATVELLRDGEVHDRTVADSTGAFVFVPKPLPPGKFELKLRATEPGGKQMVSKNSVAVELGSPAQEKAAAALAQKAPAVVPPQKPAVAPEEPAAELPKPEPQAEANTRIDLVEAQGGGKLYVSGRSAPGSTVRFYLNDVYIATGTASPEGQVSFYIGGGVKPGEYRIRLDQLAASDKVLSRAEVPFSAPATVVTSAPARPVAPSTSTSETSVAATQPQQTTSAPAATAPVKASPKTQAELPASPPVVAEVTPREIASAATSPSSSTQPPASSESPAKDSQSVLSKAAQPDAAKANRPELTTGKSGTATPPKSAAASDRSDAVVVPSIDTKVVVRGDNLWRISQTTYGHGIRYSVIYSANRAQIRDPDLIYPGQVFVLPKTQP